MQVFTADSPVLFYDRTKEVLRHAPSRHLGMATRYLEEISRAIQSGKSDYTTDELGWHAFGAVVQALAGILQHIENEKEQT